MHLLEHFLKSSKILSDASVSALLNEWQKSKKLQPKEELSNSRHPDSNLYFINDGCVRLFVTNATGEDVTMAFAYANGLVTCFQAFIESKPSQVKIEAISEITLTGISREALMKLAFQYADVSKWYQYMLETTLTGHIQRQIELLTLSPQKRYEVFLERSGHLVNNVPLKFIASYLNMSPETLSRKRAKIS